MAKLTYIGKSEDEVVKEIVNEVKDKMGTAEYGLLPVETARSITAKISDFCQDKLLKQGSFGKRGFRVKFDEHKKCIQKVWNRVKQALIQEKAGTK